MMTEVLHGACYCGSVQFTVPAAAVGVIACHCHDCQKMHGNYNVMLRAPRDQVAFAADATLNWYYSSDKARRRFCTVCGSRLFKDNLGPDRMTMSAGAIDDGRTGKRIITNLREASKGD
jgi:hypothetical protein